MTWALAIRKPPAVESPPHEVPAILLPFSPQVKQVVEVAQVEAGFLRKKQVEALVGWGWVPSKKRFWKGHETGTPRNQQAEHQVILVLINCFEDVVRFREPF